MARSNRLAEAGRSEPIDMEWCDGQLLDLVAAWEDADPGQGSRLVAGIFDQLEAEALPVGPIRVVALPRPAWRPFFECLVLEHHTFACSNVEEVRGQLAELAKGAGWLEATEP